MLSFLCDFLNQILLVWFPSWSVKSTWPHFYRILVCLSEDAFLCVFCAFMCMYIYIYDVYIW